MYLCKGTYYSAILLAGKTKCHKISQKQNMNIWKLFEEDKSAVENWQCGYHCSDEKIGLNEL